MAEKLSSMTFNSKLLTFLAVIRSSLHEILSSSNVTFVMGNEAVDLDSMVSSVGYAYILQEKYSENRFIPVIQTPRAEFFLRTDCLSVIEFCYPPPANFIENIVFVDEIEFGTMKKKFNLILTDHNILSEAMRNFSTHVTGIVDHHADEGLYPNASKEIAIVGSDTTLIVEKLNYATLDLPLAKFFLSPILIDTANLKGKMTTDRDISASKALLNFILLREPLFNKTVFYNTVLAAKLNITHFSNHDMLRKDYKRWSMYGYEVGISFVGLGLQTWVTRETGIVSIETSIQKYLQDHRLDICVIMTARDVSLVEVGNALKTARLREDTPRLEREIMFAFSDRIIATHFQDTFLRKLGEKLKLAPISFASTTSLLYTFTQLDGDSSRKVVQPAIKDALGLLVI